MSDLFGSEKPMTETAAWLLAKPFLELVEEKLQLTELPVAGEPFHTFTSPTTGETTGTIRLFDGKGIDIAVLTTANTEHIDIWQMVIFTPPESAVPHLSFEGSGNHGGSWLSVDLVPRATCLEEIDWTRYVYEPLSDAVWALHERTDLQQALIRARHRMRLSPWLVTVKLEAETAVQPASDIVQLYAARFCQLLENGIPEQFLPSVSPDELAVRDARERSHLYSWESTWNYRHLALLGGPDAPTVVQQTLINPRQMYSRALVGVASA